ncbi:MAG TPA: hypothetical protein VMT62_15070 [Syntrophorhabdaceae bacterium]|nr:hypothetical protein [Syntrophorhabdaceae bacterium]
MTKPLLMLLESTLSVLPSRSFRIALSQIQSDKRLHAFTALKRAQIEAFMKLKWQGIANPAPRYFTKIRVAILDTSTLTVVTER